MKPVTEHEKHLARVVLEGTGCWSRRLTELQVSRADKPTQDAWNALKAECKHPSRVGTVLKTLRREANLAPLHSRNVTPNGVAALRHCIHCGEAVRATWRHCGHCGGKLHS